MKYVYSMILLAFLVGCGEDSFYQKRERAVLLVSEASNQTVDETVPDSVHQEPEQPVVQDSVAVIEESNQTEATLSIVEAESNSSTESNLSATVAIPPKFEEEMSKKSFELESTLKQQEMDQKQAMIANEKEIALAKLQSEQLIAKEQAQVEHKRAELDAQNRKEIELARLESQQTIALGEKETAKEQSQYEKEVALAKLETERTISTNEQKLSATKVESEKTVALAKLEMERQQQDKDIELYKIIVAVVAGLVLLVLLIIYLIHRRNKHIELKLHEEELLHQKYIEASKQHNENVQKMLEIITDEKTDKNVKKEIVRLLKDQGKNSGLIEHKK